MKKAPASDVLRDRGFVMLDFAGCSSVYTAHIRVQLGRIFGVLGLPDMLVDPPGGHDVSVTQKPLGHHVRDLSLIHI